MSQAQRASIRSGADYLLALKGREIYESGVRIDDPATAPSTARMARTIADLLAVAPRLALKTMLRLEMFLDSATEKRVAQTDNLSASGMLVQGRSRYDEGTAFRFEFTPPGELRPIKGTGEVVRRTTPAREGVEGFAARFAEFEADGHDRLRRFLEAQISSR